MANFVAVRFHKNNKMVWIYLYVIACIFVLIVFVMYISPNGKRKNYIQIKRYQDNGRRVLINLDKNALNAIKSKTLIKCNDTTLVKCKINGNFQCFHCDESHAECVHFEMDTVVSHEGVSSHIYSDNMRALGTKEIHIPRNSHPNEGYCLSFTGSHARECSFKNGGRWIFVRRQNEKKQTYIDKTCFCSMPNIFTKSNLYGDCDIFLGCRKFSNKYRRANNEIIPFPEANIINNNWYVPEQIMCDCGRDYDFIAAKKINGSSRPPLCIEKNMFRQSQPSFIHLEARMINPDYLNGRASAGLLFLPDPCAYDLITKELTGARTTFLSDEKVAFCDLPNVPGGFVALTLSSDYLMGNNGKYPNALMRVFSKSATTLPGHIYEVATSRRNKTTYPPFVGRRFYAKDMLIDLPYLSTESRNMGGSGQVFSFAASVPKGLRDQAKVYVYSPELPESVAYKKFLLGQFVTFIPTFSNNIEINYPWFLGNVPYVHVPEPLNNFTINMIMLHLTSLHYPNFTSDGILDREWNPDYHEDRMKKYYTMPSAFFNNRRLMLNWRARNFTGIILSLDALSGMELVSKYISPGNKYLLILYRKQINPFRLLSNQSRKEPWQDITESANVYLNLYWNDRPFKIADDNLYAGENSYGFDCDGITMPPSSESKYKCSANSFEWSKNY